MFLEIVSPEATLFGQEVTSVSVPGINGEFQMLNNHAAIVSVLGKGTVKIQGDALEIAEEFQANFQKLQNTKILVIAVDKCYLEIQNFFCQFNLSYLT